MSLLKKNMILLALVVILGTIPLYMVKDSEFAGADGAAEEAIIEINPDYQPWFTNLWEPPGGETESLLFALQAACGAGFLGYYIGCKKGQKAVNKR